MTGMTKLPGATLNYGVDWTLALTGDTLSASTWTVPTGLTQVSAGFTTTVASVKLSGGEVGTVYEVTNTITTVGGNIDLRTFTLTIVAFK